MVPSNVTATLNHDGAGIYHLLAKPGKETVENKETAGQQEVNMSDATSQTSIAIIVISSHGKSSLRKLHASRRHFDGLRPD
jgi:hypothetical protein